jgi:hypothetical protein
METYVPPIGWTLQTITVSEAELSSLCDAIVERGYTLLNVIHENDTATVSAAVPKDEWLHELLSRRVV